MSNVPPGMQQGPSQMYPKQLPAPRYPGGPKTTGPSHPSNVPMPMPGMISPVVLPPPIRPGGFNNPGTNPSPPVRDQPKYLAPPRQPGDKPSGPSNKPGTMVI